MTRHRAAERNDEQPWIVNCVVQGDGAAVGSQVQVGFAQDQIYVLRPGGKPVWFTVGHANELVHFLLLATHGAAYYKPEEQPQDEAP